MENEWLNGLNGLKWKDEQICGPSTVAELWRDRQTIRLHYASVSTAFRRDDSSGQAGRRMAKALADGICEVGVYESYDSYTNDGFGQESFFWSFKNFTKTLAFGNDSGVEGRAVQNV